MRERSTWSCGQGAFRPAFHGTASATGVGELLLCIRGRSIVQSKRGKSRATACTARSSRSMTTGVSQTSMSPTIDTNWSEKARSEIRAHFAQSKDSLWRPEDATGSAAALHSLQKYLNSDTRKRARSQNEYPECEVTVNEAYDIVRQVLVDLGLSNLLLGTYIQIDGCLRRC